MRLWVDGQCLQTASRLRGIGRYVLSLLEAAARRKDVELLVSLNAAMPEGARIAREALLDFLPASNIRLWHGLVENAEMEAGFTARRQVSEIALRHHVASLAPDVALAASPFEGIGDHAVPFLPTPGFLVATAAICYDFIPLTYPDQYLQSPTARSAYERRLRRLADSSHILAISDYTAAQCRQVLPGLSVMSISAGLPTPFVRHAEQADGNVHDENTILYVGSLDWRKNVDILPRALALIPAPLRDRIELRIAGAYDEPDQQRIQAVHDSLGLAPQHLRWLGMPADGGLIAHYQKASLVVQPSLLEGFGLTALEAMACGTPVIVADAGSLPEVAGEAGVRFDPASPEDLANNLTILLEDSARRATLAVEGRARALGFTWDKVAARAVEVLAPLVLTERVSLSQSELEQQAVTPLLPLSDVVAPETIARVMALATPAAPGTRRILVDVTATVRDRHATGIQRVVRKIVAHLHAQGSDVIPTWCMQPAVVHPVGVSQDGRLADAPEAKRTLGVCPGDRWLQLDSSWSDIAAQTVSLRGARMAGARITIVVYDLIPLRTPAFCAQGMPEFFRNWLLQALTLTDNILCISRTVALDVMSYLQEIRCPRRVHVGYWPLGADFGARPNRSLHNDGRLRPRFLMVGTLEPRKAHCVALEALELLWARGMNAELVFAGKQGWDVEFLVERLRSHPEFNRRLHWHVAPGDEDLAALYGEAHAVIVPSFAEGYGLPISEALHMGVPVVASDIPVFREVAGSAGCVRFFEVGSAASLAEVLAGMMVQAGDEFAGEGRAAVPVSWAESAKVMADLLLREDWAFVHEPFVSKEGSSTDLGSAQVSALIVQGPDRRDGRYLTFVLRMVNHDTEPLSPRHAEGWLNFSAQLIKGGAVVSAASIRIQPLAAGIPAGGSCYVRMDIKTSVKGGCELMMKVEGSLTSTAPTIHLPVTL